MGAHANALRRQPMDAVTTQSWRMKMKRLIPGVIILLGLVGCESVDEKSGSNFEVKAAAAEKRGDWDAARRLYATSFANKNLGQTSPRYRSVLHYEYGRSLGVTCFFKEAEHEFSLAHDLDKKTGGIFYLSLTELGRLSLAQKKYPEAVSYFERVLAELDPIITAKKSPAFYAGVLEDYASALAGAGRPKNAEAAEKQAAEIRATLPAEQSNTERTPYGTQCPKGT